MKPINCNTTELTLEPQNSIDCMNEDEDDRHKNALKRGRAAAEGGPSPPLLGREGGEEEGDCYASYCYCH